MNLLEYILSLIFQKSTPKISVTTPIPHLLNKQQIIDAMRNSKNLSDELLDNNINLTSLRLRLYISSISTTNDSIIITTSENGSTKYNYISENYFSLSVNRYFPNIKSVLSDMNYVVIDNVKLPFSNSIANLSDGLLIINDIYIETIEELPETFYMIEF